MSGPRKIIPVTPVAATREPEQEIRGCAELEPYALRVIGDSMAPEFVDGHIVIVEPAADAQSGRFVVADYNGETYLRQYVVEHDARYLKALNPAYPAIVAAGTDFHVRGVVVQRTGRRRSERKDY